MHSTIFLLSLWPIVSLSAINSISTKFELHAGTLTTTEKQSARSHLFGSDDAKANQIRAIKPPSKIGSNGIRPLLDLNSYPVEDEEPPVVTSSIPDDPNESVMNQPKSTTNSRYIVLSEPTVIRSESFAEASKRTTEIAKNKRKNPLPKQRVKKKIKTSSISTSPKQTQEVKVNHPTTSTSGFQKNFSFGRSALTNSPTGTTATTDTFTFTHVKFPNQELVSLKRSDVHDDKARRNWFRPNYDPNSDYWRPMSIYTYHEVLGAQILYQLNQDQDPASPYYFAHFDDFSSGIEPHSIKSMVSYIYLMNRLSEPALFKDENELRSELTKVVLHLEQFWKEFDERTAGIPADSNNPFTLGGEIDHVRRQIYGTSRGLKQSNRISNFLFLSWLKSKHPILCEVMTKKSDSLAFKLWTHALLRDYAFSIMDGPGILRRLKSEDVKVIEHLNLLTCKSAVTIKIRWEEGTAFLKNPDRTQKYRQLLDNLP